MSEERQTWPIDAFDAIRISGIVGHFNLEGTDGDQVELEGESGGKWNRGAQAQAANRWLSLSPWGHHHGGDLTLRLPRSKSWVVDLFIARGDVKAKDVKARLSINMGRGDIEIENGQGQLAVAAGKGDVKVDGWQEMEMPERPPMPEPESQPAGAGFPQMPPMPEGPGAVFGFRKGPRIRFGQAESDEWRNWEDWNGEEWARWGEEVGERAAAWAEGFVSQFLTKMDWLAARGGVSLNLGQGDVELKDIVAKVCAIRMGSGDMEIDGGRVENLRLETSRGDIVCEGVLPQGNWAIELRHGDCKLKLPSAARARLDVSTRHGDIDSEIPLVRVGRPGRESRHGGRMVGTAGQADGQAPEIRISALHGDIEIEGPRGQYSGEQRAPETGRVVSQPAQPAPQPAPTAGSPQASDVPASAARPDSQPLEGRYNSQVAILQALAEGAISVQEAEKLLKSLER